MKFKLILILVPLFLLAIQADAQKVKNKKGITFVDKEPLLKIEGGSLAIANKPARILNYSNDKLLFVLTVHLKDYQTWYFEVVFADFDVRFNTRHMYKDLVLSMYQNNLFNVEGDMDQESVENWIRLFGNEAPYDWDF